MLVETTPDGRIVERTGDVVVTYAPFVAEYIHPPVKPVKHLHGNSDEYKRLKREATAALMAVRERGQ